MSRKRGLCRWCNVTTAFCHGNPSPLVLLLFPPLLELKMAVSRIQIASNKKSALLKQSMREIAVMLAEEPPKEEKAKIRAEALIRDDDLIEAYEILQLQCELLHERIKLLEYSKECPGDLIPVVSTLMWASQRVDIPELVMIRKQFRAKYGKKFEEAAMMNQGKVLNERVVSKLSVQPPAAYLVQTYLEKICAQFEVEWEPKVRLSAAQAVEPMAAPSGYSVQAAQGTGLGPESHVMPPQGKIPDANFPDHLATVVVDAQPYVSPTAAQVEPKGDDFAEVDIFVPPAAPAASHGGVSSPLTMDPNMQSESGNDMIVHSDNDRPGPPSNTNDSSSYADLAARFNQLKK